MNAQPLPPETDASAQSKLSSFHVRWYVATFRALGRALPVGWPLHVSTVIILSTQGSFIFLALFNVLWICGLIGDPYSPGSADGRYSYLWTALVIPLYTNIVLMRRRCALISYALQVESRQADSRRLALYWLGSLVSFVLTYIAARIFAVT